MKKLVSLLLVMTMLFALGACSGASGDTDDGETKADSGSILGKSGPEKTVENYFAAMKKFDIEKMDSYVDYQDDGNDDDDDYDDDDDFGDEIDEKQIQAFMDFFSKNAGKMKYKVTGNNTTGDTAVVTVDVTYVDASELFKAIFAEYMQQMMAGAMTGEEPDEAAMSAMMIDIFNDKIKDYEETTSQKTIEVRCVKKDGDWLIADEQYALETLPYGGYFDAIDDAFGDLDDYEDDMDDIFGNYDEYDYDE